MEMTPPDIRQQKFKVRFRGFDIGEVDEFLHQLADESAVLHTKMEQASKDVRRLEKENKEYREREETFTRAWVSSQKVMEQMKENAKLEKRKYFV